MAGLTDFYDDYPGKDVQDRRYYRDTGIGRVLGGRRPKKKERVAYDTGETTETMYGEKPVYRNIEVDVSPNPSDWHYSGDTATPPERLMRPGMAATPVTPPAPMPPPPMPSLERMAAQKRYSPTEAQQGQAAVMKAQGYSPLNQAFSAADGSKPANIFYQEQDGKTRYTIPGESAMGGGPGFAEFQGKRQGGGSFSVVSGRTPEEQAAIDKRVAGINKQIDAQRIKQGKPTLAEEARLNAMGNLVNRFATPPNNMTPQQMELWKLQQAQITGMLAQQAEQDKYRAAEMAAQQKAEQEQYRYGVERGDKARQERREDRRDQRAATQQERDYAIRAKEAVRRYMPTAIEQKSWYQDDPVTPGVKVFNPAATGIPSLPASLAETETNKIYLDGDKPVTVDENGNKIPFDDGLQWAVFLTRAKKAAELGLLPE